MTETLEKLVRLRAAGRPVVMATLVAVHGAGPRREGARMFVDADGAIVGGVTIGGCVDARVVALAEEMLRAPAAAPALLAFALGDEDAELLGLTCRGTVDVRVERLDGAGALGDAYDAVAARVQAGGAAALLVPLRDPTTRDAVLVVADDGTTRGTLGDAALDARAAVAARPLLARGASRTIEVEAGGGAVTLFCETHAPRPTLVVFGAGPVAIPLVRLARVLGLRTVVVDARARWATPARFPEADELRVGSPSEVAATMAFGRHTVVAVVAHDYKWELPVLQRVLPSEAAYVGVLGSRRRGAALRELLREQGVPDESLARLHVPAGLDIGAESAAEIALSMLAEAVAERAGRRGGALRDAVGGGRPAPGAGMPAEVA